jgi:hypothetical protein
MYSLCQSSKDRFFFVENAAAQCLILRSLRRQTCPTIQIKALRGGRAAGTPQGPSRFDAVNHLEGTAGFFTVSMSRATDAQVTAGCRRQEKKSEIPGRYNAAPLFRRILL